MSKYKKIKKVLIREYYNAIYTVLYAFKMLYNKIVGYDHYEREFRVRCPHCKWVGFEDQIEGDYYDSYNGSNDCYLCPDCGAAME